MDHISQFLVAVVVFVILFWFAFTTRKSISLFILGRAKSKLRCLKTGEPEPGQRTRINISFRGRRRKMKTKESLELVTAHLYEVFEDTQPAQDFYQIQHSAHGMVQSSKAKKELALATYWQNPYLN